jgi:hypothetical protein
MFEWIVIIICFVLIGDLIFPPTVRCSLFSHGWAIWSKRCLVKARFDDNIYPNTWKEIDTGMEFEYFPMIFGHVRYSFSIDKELCVKRGLSVHYVSDDNHLTIAFFNHHDYPVRLRPGMVLGHVRFFKAFRSIVF